MRHSFRALRAAVLLSSLLVLTTTSASAQSSNATFQETWSWLLPKIHEGQKTTPSWEKTFRKGWSSSREDYIITGNPIEISYSGSSTYKSIVDISMAAPGQPDGCILKFREFHHNRGDSNWWIKRDYKIPLYDLGSVTQRKREFKNSGYVYEMVLQTTGRKIEIHNKQVTELRYVRDMRRLQKDGRTQKTAKTVENSVDLYFYNPEWDMREMTRRMTNAFNHLRTICLPYKPKSNEPF